MLDYYNNEPDKTFWAGVLNACGKANGVTIEREAVPGDTLIQKVLQQSSSKTLPDVLMLDNPDLQQIAETGALATLGQFGLSADGYIQGVVDASTYQGKLYGLQPITNTIGLFYNKDILDKAGVKPPTTWDELKAAAKQLTSGKQYGIAFSAPANYEGTWQFLPFMWSNGGDEKNIATPETADALQLWVDLVEDGSASRSVVNWTPGRRERPVQGRQRGDDDQRPVAVPGAERGQVAELRGGPDAGAEGRRDRGLAARRRDVDRARDGRHRAPGEGGQDRRVPELGREPAEDRRGSARRSRPRRRCRSSSSPTSRR